MEQSEIIKNLKRCNRFNECSANICPLDNGAYLRKNLPDEKRCPYTINRKNKKEKGIKTLMPTHLLNFIPARNLKILNKRNQRRWTDLNK